MKIVILATAVLALALLSATPSGAQTLEEVSIEVDPTNSSVVLGESLEVAFTVTNGGTMATPDSVVHIDITDPGQSSSVDPEDWTSTLSKPIGQLAPGATTTVAWTIQPISPGTFSAYAVVLSADASTVASSDVLRVEVLDQRSLNPGGILPVALGAPAFIGGLLAWQRIRTRWRS